MRGERDVGGEQEREDVREDVREECGSALSFENLSVYGRKKNCS